MKTVMIEESMYIVEILVKNYLVGANFNLFADLSKQDTLRYI